MFNPTEFVKRLPLHVQIRESLREAIRAGELRPGMRLPSSQQLCQTYQTGASVVQSALSALTAEGLIERKPGAGSFVKGDVARLCRVGLYYYSFFWTDGGMDFYRLLYGQLHTLLEREHIQSHPFLGAYKKDHSLEHFPKAILTAARGGEIQALFCPLISGISESAYQELGIPVVCLNRCFAYDHNQMATLTCEYLARQGCRTLGAIVSGNTPELLRSLQLAAERFHLQLSDEAIVYPENAITHDQLQQFGYQAIGELCRRKSQPEGLFVYPDSIVQGVAMGILNRGIRVPEQMKLVVHRNEGLPVFTPFPAASVVSSPTRTAEAMVDIARRIVAGENPPKQSLPHTLVEPE